MYDDANFYGYATRRNKKYFVSDILKIAKEKNITLAYNCLP